ncbi:uncharacterized protein AMSG_03365 [Thecamonas trahens ATCC 50062]|uniref:Uncharacterized protein n=1 Tax=Thecamonas trahens ATCC 50062 TaxID=461836 RepID=A0A0L0D6K1_THETB|nr:hypothetical protein AMSG_03365 [Thecamonas trahens ATCC 50062]KNC46933.1 hypothetical protein AMSG_03365 [Thecamonas trahens ATCC 50062]|eukprot:XP_013760205.1 hypothetical protein AMSG_03365 [Thecamonas trahens ATCC 50062]
MGGHGPATRYAARGVSNLLRMKLAPMGQRVFPYGMRHAMDRLFRRGAYVMKEVAIPGAALVAIYQGGLYLNDADHRSHYF